MRCPAFVLALLAFQVAAQAAAQTVPADTLELDEVEVVGATPVPGTAVAASRLAASVQSLDAGALQRLRPLGLADALARGLGGVQRVALGGNERQPDVVVRGFQASPLLGLPQGLAVTLDGARVNEAFGDVVHWDLIPEGAVARVTALPGSNPVFGLNALGGALAVETKDGFTSSGAAAEASGGSFGRVGASAEVGGRVGHVGGARVAVFAAAQADGERGWRDFSQGRGGSAFVKGSLLGARTLLDVSVLAALSDLRGNGAVPLAMLEDRRQAVFTHPDQTTNRLVHGAARAQRVAAPGLTLTATAHGRRLDAETLNGDDSDYAPCLDDAGSLCAQGAGGRRVRDLLGAPVPFSNAVATGTLHRTATGQLSGGVTLQADVEATPGAVENRLVVGVAVDGGLVGFGSSTELGALTDTRAVAASGRVDGESRVSVDARSGSLSAYVLDQVRPAALGGRATLTLGARATWTRVVLDDQIGTALDGDHTFARLNPSVGLAVAVGLRQRPEAAVVYGGVGVSHRAPSPVELTCADPEDPCRLPNGFQADPPLDAPVAATASLGVRAGVGGLRVAVAGFYTGVRRDILFVSAGRGRAAGYFRNVGTTRRLGAEAQVEASRPLGPTALGPARVEARASVAALHATFRDGFTVNSPGHPLAVHGEVDVQPGDRLPLLAPLTVGLGADLDAGRLGVSADLQAVGARFVRGDETNALDALPAYAVLNARVRWALGPSDGLAVFAEARNLLGARYETAGLLGEADGGGPDGGGPDGGATADDAPLFLTPGAPRALRLGLAYAF